MLHRRTFAAEEHPAGRPGLPPALAAPMVAALELLPARAQAREGELRVEALGVRRDGAEVAAAQLAALPAGLAPVGVVVVLPGHLKCIDRGRICGVD